MIGTISSMPHDSSHMAEQGYDGNATVRWAFVDALNALHALYRQKADRGEPLDVPASISVSVSRDGQDIQVKLHLWRGSDVS